MAARSETPFTWAEFKAALIKKFGMDPDVAWNMMNNRKQGANESVADYTAAMCKLFSQCKASSDDQRRHFLDGLRHDLKDRIITASLCRSLDLNDAIDAAKRLESAGLVKSNPQVDKRTQGEQGSGASSGKSAAAQAPSLAGSMHSHAAPFHAGLPRPSHFSPQSASSGRDQLPVRTLLHQETNLCQWTLVMQDASTVVPVTTTRGTAHIQGTHMAGETNSQAIMQTWEACTR